MIFTIGNLIVLLVVCVILAIFRRLDRTNRAINVVKRAADKANKDLEGVVAERSSVVKDMAIELEVNQRAGRELLRTVRTTEEVLASDLKAREGYIAQLEQSLEEYRQEFRVQESSRRELEKRFQELQEQAQRIEGTRDALALSAERFTQLQSTIPEIIAAQNAEFEKRLTERYQGFEQQLASLMSSASTLQEVVRRSEGEAEGHIKEQSVQILERFEREFQSALKRLQNSGRVMFRQNKGQHRAVARHVASLREGQQEYLDKLHREFEKSLRTRIEGEGEKAEKEIRRVHEELLKHNRAHNVSLMEEHAHHMQSMNTQYQENIARMEGMRSSLDEFSAQLTQQLQESQEGAERRIDEHRDYVDQQVGALNDFIGEAEQTLRQTTEEHESRLTSEQESREKDLQERYKRFEDHLQQEIARCGRVLEEETARQRGLVTEQVAAMGAMTEERSQQIEQQYSELDTLLKRESERLNDKIERFRKSSEEGIIDTSRSLEAVSERAKRMEQDYSEKEQQLHAMVEGALSEAKARMQADMEHQSEATGTKTTEILERATAIEQRISAVYEESTQSLQEQTTDVISAVERHVSGGLKKLEEVQRQITGVGNTLHNEYSKSRSQLEQMASTFRKNKQKALQDMQSEYEHRLGRQLEQIRSGIAKHKQRVDKRLAYNDEELQAHIQNRFEQITKRFSEHIGTTQHELEEQLGAVNTTFQSQWQSLRELNETTLQEIERGAEQIAQQQAHQSEQVQSFEKSVDAQREELQASVDDIRVRFDEEVQKSISDMSANISHAVKLHENEFGDRLDQINRDLEERIDAKRAELLQAYTSETENAINQQRHELSERQDGVNNEVAQWRIQVNQIIKDSQNEIQDVRHEIANQSQSALKDFDARYTQFRNELEEQSNAMLKEAQTRTVELTTRLEGEREEVERVYQERIAQFQVETKRLRSELVKIDRAQGEFNHQTKIIGKVDKLHQTLTTQVAQLHEDIVSIEHQQAEAKQIHAEYHTMQETATQLYGRFERLGSEKRKIESLEKQWTRLLELSKTVNTQVESLENRNDQLMTLQERMRTIDELSREVEKRSTKLEQRQALVESLGRGIEKNNQSLVEIETHILSLKEGVSALPDEVAGLTSRIEELSSKSREAHETEILIKELTSTSKAIDAKMQELKGSQNWLARAETRLKNISAEADDRLNLLNALLERSTTGAEVEQLPHDQREMVLKLSQNGWSPEQIARQTKVSVGEIEFILGVLTRSRRTGTR